MNEKARATSYFYYLQDKSGILRASSMLIFTKEWAACSGQFCEGYQGFLSSKKQLGSMSHSILGELSSESSFLRG